MRQAGSVKAVVNVTSDKCYENREWVWGYRETEAMGGYDPYSSSKGCAELVAAAYRTSYFNPADYQKHGIGLASVRAGNVIGGGDWGRRPAGAGHGAGFLGGSRRSTSATRMPSAPGSTCWSRSAATCWWQKSFTPTARPMPRAGTSAHVRATRSRCNGSSNSWWHCGADGAAWQHDQSQQPHEAHYLKLDCSKAAARLGWMPRWTLGEALGHIVDWQKAHLSGGDMRAKMLAQIAAYTNAG